MKKEITHQDKLNFYKKFHSEDFIKLYQSLEQRSAGYGFMLTRVLSTAAFIAGFFIPWFFLVLLATDLPILVHDINRHKKRKLLIESLVEGITYRDFVEMTENGEWQQLGAELAATDLPSMHLVENKNLVKADEPKLKNEILEENSPSAQFIENIQEFVTINNGTFLEYYTYDGFSETNETFIVIKTHNGKVLEFVVTPEHFICVFEELDYSSEWKDFLFSKNFEDNA